MTLGTIKLETLKLMFTNYDIDTTVEDIPDLLTNSDYKDYLFSMPGSINRCLARFAANKMNPQKKVNVKTLFTKVEGEYVFDGDAFYVDDVVVEGATNVIYDDDGELYRFDGDGYEKISKAIYIDMTVISDFFRLNRIALTKADGTIEAVTEFLWEDKTLIIPYINLFPETEDEYEGKYNIFYYSLFPTITASTSETTEIDLPEPLLQMIPYYIKGELYQEDSSVLANEARNIFEQMLAEYPGEETNRQTSVRMKYRQDKL